MTSGARDSSGVTLQWESFVEFRLTFQVFINTVILFFSSWDWGKGFCATWLVTYPRKNYTRKLHLWCWNRHKANPWKVPYVKYAVGSRCLCFTAVTHFTVAFTKVRHLPEAELAVLEATCTFNSDTEIRKSIQVGKTRRTHPSGGRNVVPCSVSSQQWLWMLFLVC